MKNKNVIIGAIGLIIIIAVGVYIFSGKNEADKLDDVPASGVMMDDKKDVDNSKNDQLMESSEKEVSVDEIDEIDMIDMDENDLDEDLDDLENMEF